MCCEMRALNVISPVVIASHTASEDPTLMTTQLDGGPVIDVYK
jgi:hypothetical protein